MIVGHGGAVIHDDHVALLDHAGTGLGVRVGAIGTTRDDCAKGQAIGAVGEHVVLELGANLLLGKARLDAAADVAERLVGHLLGGAHELDLLGILHGAQLHEVAMQARQQARNGALGKRRLQGVEELEGARVLDGHDAGMGLADAICDPLVGAHDGLVELPGGVVAQTLAEGVVVARVGVEQLARRRDDHRVGHLVVERALAAREPAQVGVVAKDHGVIAALLHDVAELGDARGAGLLVCHGSSFPRRCIRESKKRRGRVATPGNASLSRSAPRGHGGGRACDGSCTSR